MRDGNKLSNMKNWLFAFVLLTVPFGHSFSQDSVWLESGQLLDDNAHKVLIIPFSYRNYLSDSDHDIAKKSDKSIREVQEAFRYGLDLNISYKVMAEYNTWQLLTDTSADAQSDLKMIYGNISYRYDRPQGELTVTEEPEELPRDKMKKWFNKTFKEDKKGDQISQDFEDGTVKPRDKSRKYMHAEVHDKEMFQYLHEKYGTDVFLFVNQFELNTNYQSCIDRATQNFAREVSIHYAIYNLEGKLLHGDVFTVMFSSNTNDLEEIISTNFPIIGNHVAATMPAERRF